MTLGALDVSDRDIRIVFMVIAFMMLMVNIMINIVTVGEFDACNS